MKAINDRSKIQGHNVTIPQFPFARRRGRIPDLELDAVRLLRDDYIVDNAKLKSTGYELLYPDFRASMREIGRAAPALG